MEGLDLRDVQSAARWLSTHHGREGVAFALRRAAYYPADSAGHRWWNEVADRVRLEELALEVDAFPETALPQPA